MLNLHKEFTDIGTTQVNCPNLDLLFDWVVKWIGCLYLSKEVRFKYPYKKYFKLKVIRDILV